MLIKLVHYIERSAHAIEFIKDLFLCPLFKKAMNRCGHNVKIKPSTSVYYGLNNLSLGNNVSIPRYAHIFCTEAPLYIGDNVIFGPAPTIVTGDHRIDQIGTPTFFTTEKKAENDLPVIIEDDVWIGAHVTILKGVTIGRGSVVAAGSVHHAQLVDEIRSGAPWYLDDDATQSLMEANRPFLRLTDLDDILRRLFRQPSSPASAQELTASEIAAIVRREYPKLPPSKASAKAVGRALTSIGFNGRHSRNGTCYMVETEADKE